MGSPRSRLLPRLLVPAGAAWPDRFTLTCLAFPTAALLFAFAVLRMTYPGSIEQDDADLVLFGQSLAWGYSDMSPLYAWLTTAAFGVFGVGVVALTVVRVAVLFAVSVLLYLNARLICPDRRLAVLAAHSVLLIPALIWNGLAYLTHTNLLIAACLWVLYTFLRLVRDGRTRDYVLFGAACGVGVLAKYNAAWFIAALVVGGLTVGPARRRMLDRRVMVAVAVGAVLVLPHAVWLLDRWSSITGGLRYKAVRYETAADPHFLRTLLGLKELLLQILLLAGPVAAAIVLAFPRTTRPLPNGESFPDIGRRLVARFLAFGVLVLLLQVAAIGATRMHERWVVHFVAVVPLWLFARLDPTAIHPRRLRAFAALLVVFAVGYTTARAIQVSAPAGVGYGWHPIKESDDELARQIAAEAGDRPTIVTPLRTQAGNLRLRLPAAHVCCTSLLEFSIPPGDGPVVVVWDMATGPQPPWPGLQSMLHVTGTNPIPPASIRTVVVAPGKPGVKPPTVLAFAVLPPRQ